MRTIFEEEEDVAPPQPDRELTLSSTTLLAIFFGLVLICGLFFGLGYTLGRRAPSDSNSDTVSSPAAPSASTTNSLADAHQKPSPATQTETAPAPTSETVEPPAADPEPDLSPSSTLPQGATPVKAAFPASAQPAAQTTAQPKPVVLQAALQPSPTAGQSAQAPPGIMVQIAAVSNPADANVLISALQKRGYSVTARRQATDPLIHVQVGPFPSRADAIAMRQKLLGDGYNAILK